LRLRGKVSAFAARVVHLALQSRINQIAGAKD
jgi:hypothetical protein